MKAEREVFGVLGVVESTELWMRSEVQNEGEAMLVLYSSWSLSSILDQVPFVLRTLHSLDLLDAEVGVLCYLLFLDRRSRT